MIPDTSGLGSPMPFALWNHDSSCWRMSQGTLFSDSTESSVTLPKAGSMRNGCLCERPTLAHRTDGNGCLLLLATPTAHPRTHTPRQVHHGAQLANQVDALLPTPTAGDSTAHRNKLPPTGLHAGDTLTDVAWKLLPTPTARLGVGGPDYRQRPNGPDLQLAVRSVGDDSPWQSSDGSVTWDELPLPLWLTALNNSTPDSSSG